ncbi:MAG: glutaredoxin family protein [Burkholderiales bacterium]|nr:glutaredoxin family protein [Burkholderiales bacterium]
MKTLVCVITLLLTATAAQAAQLYRWVDEKGRVEWRDTPPPANAKKVERRTVGGSVVETSTLPFSVQQAMQNFPLVLYVTDCGDGCTKARAHLNRRGLPFSERNPQDDIETYKKLTEGRLEVPLLFVGRQALRGYEEGAWDSALDAAGYPRVVIGAKPQPKPVPPPAPKPAPADAPAAAAPGTAAPTAPPPPASAPTP